jgi:hypothetical protein
MHKIECSNVKLDRLFSYLNPHPLSKTCSYKTLLDVKTINVPHAVLWNRNYFLRFRFRFRLLKSYGFGSGSDFRKSYGSGSGSGSYFRKVTVPIPVPAPYLDHKKQIFQKNFWKYFALSCFTRKKFINFNKFNVKCE